MATIEIPDYLFELADTTPDELNAELAALTPQDAVERLERISRAAQDFMLFVVYELRTPITAMIGYSDILLLSDHRLPPDKQRDIIAAIRENGQRVSREIDTAFDIFRYENGTLGLQLDGINLNVLIKKVISEILEQVDHSYEQTDNKRLKIVKPEFVYTIPDEIPGISVDERRIYRILIEALTETIRIYDRNCESKIAFTVSYDDNWVTIKVCDDGVGLSRHLEEQAPRLSPINQHIVEMHGGKVDIEKSESGGWIIEFILPIHQERSSQ